MNRRPFLTFPLACAVALLACAAEAQVVVLDAGNAEFAAIESNANFTKARSLDEAFITAKAEGITEIWIAALADGSAWTGMPVLDSTHDGYIIRGLPFDAPWRAIVGGSTGTSVFDIGGTKNLLIEGITITGGDEGVLVTGAAGVTLNRCIIRDNGSHGVSAEGTATVNVYHSSVANNGADGVHIAGDAVGNINFSSVIFNDDDGVEVSTSGSGTAKVYSSLIWGNTGDTMVEAPADSITQSSNWAENLDTIGETADLVGTTDPKLALGDVFPGKLQDDTSPLVDAVDGSNIPGGFLSDIEGQLRPYDPNPDGTSHDIGCDEYYVVGAGARTWYLCEVTPVGGLAGDPIGALKAGELRVRIGVDGGLPDRVFIVPQGEAAIAGDATNRIEIEPTFASGGIWEGANTQDITTVLFDRPPQGLDAGDVIADGHGAVYLAYGALDDSEDIVGNDYDRADVDFSADFPIIEQALVGRHVLIDTTPPSIGYNPETDLPAAAYLFLQGSNDTFTSMDVWNVLGAVTHPYPASPAQLPSGKLWAPATYPTPWDEGGIAPVSGDRFGPGASMYFNRGSKANNLYAYGAYSVPPELRNLQIVVSTSRMWDYGPLRDAGGNEIAAYDYFKQSPQVRPVAGFDAPPASQPVVTTVGDLLDPKNEDQVIFQFAPGAPQIPGDVEVEVTHGLSGSNDQYPYSGQGSSSDLTNKYDQATWDFITTASDGTTPVGSIPFSLTDDEEFHTSLIFFGTDRAGNRTRDLNSDEGAPQVFDPLNIWWMVDTETHFTNRNDLDEQLEPASVSVAWSLDRAYDPESVSAPKPIYTYRVWRSSTGGPEGPYVPASEWATWSEQTQVGAEYFADNALLGQWLLMVVAGADEAGNVTRWPGSGGSTPPTAANLAASDLYLWSGGLGEVVYIGGASRTRPNWVRFSIRDTSAPDTRLSADFWHGVAVGRRADYRGDVVELGVSNYDFDDPGELHLGANLPIVPMPPKEEPFQSDGLQLDVQFHVEAIEATDGSGNRRSGDLYLRIELFEDGNEGDPVASEWLFVGDGLGENYLDVYLPANRPGGINVKPTDVVLPARDRPATQDRPQMPFSFGDPDRERPVVYTLRVTAWQDIANFGFRDDEELDPTPATLQFVVVPDESVEAYYRNAQSPDEQPVRAQN